MAIPVNTVAPVVTGTVAVGSVLTTGAGSWDELPDSFKYAWLRDGVLIAGAEAETYTLGHAEALSKIASQVTASNVDGDSLPVLSEETSSVPGTLIVEDGTGFLDADSYCSVEFADEYHAARGNLAWGLTSGGDREASLRKATEYLDAYYGARWLGETYADGQSLDWPRSYVPAPDRSYGGWGYSVAAWLEVSPLPVVLVRATAELALKTASGTVLDPDLSPAVKQETVGPITVIYQDRSTNVVTFSAVENMLSRLLKSLTNIRLARG